MFKQAYKAAEVNYKKSIQTQHQSSTNEAIHRKNSFNISKYFILIYLIFFSTNLSFFFKLNVIQTVTPQKIKTDGVSSHRLMKIKDNVLSIILFD